ncbi:MAG: DUF6263 family protein [Tenuifilaceae bacterium]|jgi:hypothetical protein|nr:DUF6263 family protein [Tenuifilaceae bacterium]
MKTIKLKVAAAFLILAIALPFSAEAVSEVTLRVKLDKGAEVKYSSSTEQVITQTIGAMKQVINQNQVFEYTIGVTSKLPNGNMQAKITFTRIAIDMETQGMSMKFDSEKKDDGPVANPQFLVFGALINKSVSATITPLGNIVEVTGIEELRKQMLSETAGQAQIEQTIGAAISQDAIKQMFGGAFISYPEKGIKAKSTWTDNQTIENQFTLNIINSYSVLSMDANEVKLSLSATMSTIPGNKSNMMGMQVTYNLFGTTSGNLTINPKTGMISESFMEQSINGNIAGDMMGQKMDIPMVITSKTTVKQVK